MLLSSVNVAAGNSLSTQQVPTTASDSWLPLSLSTDIKAWNNAIHTKRSTAFPKRHTRWAIATTKHFLYDWVIQGQGFTTYLNVTAGAILVMVGKPKVEMQLVMLFDPVNSNMDIWECQSFFLEAKSQIIIPPNRPYRFFALENSICQGGGFYHVSTIIPSCVGVMQTFIYGNFLSDHSHFQASRMLLGRILMYFHQEICQRKALDDEQGEFPAQNKG
ncbi:hypothetical protein BYT27DRAFT_7110605 [Phlegmacium glaucopus]|nr:hypothetical protein BYT27DRAFT_7110605 [Phlegmacium glaucopus]